MRLLFAGLLIWTTLALGQEIGRVQRVWVNDEAYGLVGQKSFMNPRLPGLPAIYLIGQVFMDEPKGLDGAGGSGATAAHDLVAEAPSGKGPHLEIEGRILMLRPGRNATAYNAATRVISTPSGELTLLFAADTNGDGVAEPLTSVKRIEAAISRGIASPEPAPVAFGSTLTLLRLR